MSEYDENFDNEEIVVILFMVMAREGEAVKKSVFFVLVVVRPKKSELATLCRAQYGPRSTHS